MMPRLGLTLYLAFLAVAFGWRTWRQYRRTGDHGFRGLARPVGSVAWYGGVALVIGVSSAVLAPLAQLVGLVEPWPALDGTWAHLVGVLTALTGIALTVLAQLQMLGALALSLIGIEIQVRKVEEPYLARAHGERYLTYARDVGRFAPGFGRFDR